MDKILTIKEAAKYVKVSIPSFKKFINKYEDLCDQKIIEKELLDRIIIKESLKADRKGGI